LYRGDLKDRSEISPKIHIRIHMMHFRMRISNILLLDIRIRPQEFNTVLEGIQRKIGPY